MAMILDPFVSRYVNDVAAFVEGEICKVLGVKKKIKALQETLETIRRFLQDAEQKSRSEYTGMELWVRKLKEVMYDADDVIDLCVMEGGKLLEARASASASGAVSLPLSFVSSCFRCTKYRHQIAGQIEAINDRLKRIAADSSIHRNLQPASQQLHPKKPPPPRETSPLEVEEDIVGEQIEEAADNLINLMLENTEKKCRVFGIVGMGGIGKTTLASKIYNDERINANFPIRKWLYISKDYSEIKLLRELIRCAGGETKAESFEGESRAELEPKLASLLTKNLFLVLDDVWSPNVWTDFLRKPVSKGAGSSTILVTTRIETVLRGMKATYIHQPEKMDDNSGWMLLGKTVFEAGEEDDMRRLEEVGRKIVRKCDGLPLAIKAIAGVLISKERSTAEWEQVLENDAWSTNRQIDEVPRALHLSYEDLPSHLKQCFLYCSFFIGNWLLDYTDVVRFWVAEGLVVEQEGRLMEDVAEEYYWELVWRNLLQVDPAYVNKGRFYMHEHLRSLGEYLMKEEGLSITDGQRLDIKANAKIRRLSISNMGIKLVLPDQIIEEKCLRTLLVKDSLPTTTIEDNVLEGLPNLRVLDLTDTSIERIPNCIGDLLHLRYLDLDRTKIHEIPESIGRLVNLQTLNISGCKHLHRLPMTITRLHNLRSLAITYTPLTHVPKGIGKLINVNKLRGFVVGHDNPTNEVGEAGCGLEELQPLSQLRYLSIFRLERAVTAASALAEKRSLRELILSWMPPEDGEDGGATDSGEDRRANWRKKEQIQLGAEKICSEFSPPSSLRTLFVQQFPGRQFPNWMMSSSLGETLPNLQYLSLSVFPSCTELPPLGMLPLLKYLQIMGAKAVKTIGPEFLDHSFPGTCSFPKLEFLGINDMPNWEEWSLCEVEEGGHRTFLKLFPNLTKCSLVDCPKLRALPEGLSHATNLKELYIWRAHNLREVTKLRLNYKLIVRDNKMLNRISNVAMKYLKVMDCPNLEYVDNLDKLQHLVLRCPEHMDQLPQWLSRLFDQQRPNSAQWSFSKLEVYCNNVLLRSCLEGNEHWNIIQRIPDVKFHTYSEEYMRYTKDPYMHDTNGR
ncbi:Disease resistance protein [Musa troglodytarum]|uniref:Disease resistance protein n=1 Tax=Musa troglodytarum TaxID=320322 RepID=A0A9E7LBH8_9LILI|nr:Disease resistance protein [Musa troglodytarum]